MFSGSKLLNSKIVATVTYSAARSLTMASLAFIGLFLLHMPIVRAADTQVLSVYINNAGAALAYGTSADNQPRYQNTLNTWESSELYNQPPNLFFNDSPLVLFRKLIAESAPQLKKIIDKKMPLKIYLAAAGADAAATMSIPKSSTLINLLTQAQTERCYKHELNRAQFYACVFGEEIREQIMEGADLAESKVELEQDQYLINEIAAIHSGTISNDEPTIVVHSTTLGQPYLTINGRAKSLGSWVPESMRRSGGIYEIGQILQGYLHNNRDSNNPLRYVLMHDPMTANHPDGAAANIERFQSEGKGYNNFGYIAGETANGLNERRVQLDLAKKVIYQQAQLSAESMLNVARGDMVRLANMLYALEEETFAGKTPRLIIVGEEADLMFSNEDVFRKTVRDMLAKGHDLLPTCLYETRTDLKDKDKHQQWLDKKGVPFMDNVTILPSWQMSTLQHQVAVKKMGAAQ